jgi:hypothetical protein
MNDFGPALKALTVDGLKEQSFVCMPHPPRTFRQAPCATSPHFTASALKLALTPDPACGHSFADDDID